MGLPILNTAQRRSSIFYIRLAVLVCCMVLALFFSLKAAAQEFTWTTGDPQLTTKQSSTLTEYDCEHSQKIPVDGFPESPSVCIEQGTNVRFGMTDAGQPVVGYGYDRKMYKILGLCYGPKNCKYLPQDDTLVAM